MNDLGQVANGCMNCLALFGGQVGHQFLEEPVGGYALVDQIQAFSCQTQPLNPAVLEILAALHQVLFHQTIDKLAGSRRAGSGQLANLRDLAFT